MIRHKSTAVISQPMRGYGYAQMETTKQFRYLVRLAVACNAAKVDYDVSWSLTSGQGPSFRRETKAELKLPNDQFHALTQEIDANNRKWLECQPRATITVTAEKIPAAKALPKAPAPRVVADWKPRFHEAEYKLDAYDTREGRQPGFVIEHSSGLSLMCPSSTGEWGEGAEYGDADPAGKNWRVQHTKSGLGFGIQQTLAKAAKALLLAASCPVDWTQPREAFDEVKFRAAGAAVLAAFGSPEQKRRAATMQHIAAQAVVEAAKPKVEGQCKFCCSIGVAGEECECCEPQDGLGPMIYQPLQVAA